MDREIIWYCPKVLSKIHSTWNIHLLRILFSYFRNFLQLEVFGFFFFLIGIGSVKLLCFVEISFMCCGEILGTSNILSYPVFSQRWLVEHNLFKSCHELLTFWYQAIMSHVIIAIHNGTSQGLESGRELLRKVRNFLSRIIKHSLVAQMVKNNQGPAWGPWTVGYSQ